MDTLKFAKAFMMLSDMTAETDEQKAKTKERIVFATMRHNIPDWEPPQDWNSLTAKERLRRLEQIQNNI